MSVKTKIITILLIAVFFTGIIVIQERIEIENTDEDSRYDLYYVPNPEYLHIISAGFREFLADVYWIKTVLYFGKRTGFDDMPIVLARMRHEKVETPEFFELRDRNRERFKYLYDLCNIVTELDPYFLDPYTFGGLFLSFKTDRADLSVKLLEKGKKFRPDTWKIPYLLGFNYYFFLENEDKAVENFMLAAEQPDCPTQLINLAQGILVKQGRTEIARTFIQGILDSTENEKVRQEMEMILDRLKQEKSNNSLNKADKSL